MGLARKNPLGPKYFGVNTPNFGLAPENSRIFGLRISDLGIAAKGPYSRRSTCTHMRHIAPSTPCVSERNRSGASKVIGGQSRENFKQGSLLKVSRRTQGGGFEKYESRPQRDFRRQSCARGCYDSDASGAELIRAVDKKLFKQFQKSKKVLAGG